LMKLHFGRKLFGLSITVKFLYENSNNNRYNSWFL
jgi:hypothetical protein